MTAEELLERADAEISRNSQHFVATCTCDRCELLRDLVTALRAALKDTQVLDWVLENCDVKKTTVSEQFTITLEFVAREQIAAAMAAHSEVGG